MTTIIYDHHKKEIAVDSQLTAGDTLITLEHNKVLDNEKGTFIVTGSTADIEVCIREYPAMPKVDHILECTMFLVKNNKCYLVDYDADRMYVEEMVHSYAIGSDRKWAQSALNLGLPAKAAIEFAIKNCIYTGGKVQVM